MKYFLIAVTLISFNAKADVRECTQSTETLTSIIRQYTDLMRYCQYNPQHPSYSAFQQNARDLETLYGRAESLCVESCSFDSFSASLCTRISYLQGACP